MNGYYIFQPFDEKENVPMYYRTNYNYNYRTKLSFNNFLDNSINANMNKKIIENKKYEFDDDYYDRRDEFDYVGIIDMNESGKDVFKLREKRKKILDVKRAEGIPSFKGAVCNNAKTKKYLKKLLKTLDIAKSYKNRDSMCDSIMEKLMDLEKYSTGKNIKTYLMIPSNHEKYKFPLNLEDRINSIIKKTNNILENNVNFTKLKNKKSYELQFSFNVKNKNSINDLKNIGWISSDNKWSIIID